ncbi:MAG: class I SAM-dependent methyltransferase [Gammaproteobacteria bacterium]|nr:class I SAM-dependent methyltransferase [Gammaproteobacteria bacterium]
MTATGTTKSPRRSSARGNYATLLGLLKAHPGKGPVLDCPCGQGALAQMLLAEGFSDLEVADYTPGLYLLPAPRPVRADLNGRLPWPDGHFEVAICADGMSDIGFQRNAIAEFHRILRPGGALLISLPNVLNFRSRLRFLFTGFMNKFRRPLDELHGQSTTRPVPWWELRYMLVREGFEITTLTCNRVKPAEALAAPLLLLTVPALLWNLVSGSRKGDDAPYWNDVHRELNSLPVLFGESLIIAARRKA